MKEIIALCIRRPVTVIMLLSVVFLGAVYSLRLLALDRLPEIIFPELTVETSYPGMGAAEVRSALTIPLEDSLSSVKGLESIKSVSRDDSSLLRLSFRWGTYPARAAALIREAVDAVYPSLPYGVSKPLVISGGPSDEAHAIVAVRSLTDDLSFARNLAEYELRSRFRSIDGAGAVIISGGERQEIRIRSDPNRLAARSLSSRDFAGMIAHESADFPAGSAREGNKELTVISSGRPRSEEELAALILSTNSGPLRISDISRTELESSKRQSLFIFDDQDQTAIEIFRRPGADPIRLSNDIKKIIEESLHLFSRDAEISLVFDSSPSILRDIRELLVSITFAALAVILLLKLFLGRLRYSLLSALSLPFSTSLAIIALAAAGRSINSMSLSGLALGIGLVSDPTVVVLDLLCRSYDNSQTKAPPLEAGTLVSSVSLSSLAGALTTMVVFLPVIFLPGPLGELFGDLSLALIVSVISGWVYSQFCLPSLFCFSMGQPLRQRPLARVLSFSIIEKLEERYAYLLRKVLRRAGPMIAFSTLASILGIFILYSRPAEFITPDTVSEIEVTVDFPSGTRMDEALRAGLDISRALSSLSGISSLYGRMGAEADDPGRRADPDYKKERLLFRCFLERRTNAPDMLERIRETLKDFEATGKALISAGYPNDRTAVILGLSPALTLAITGSSPEESSVRAEALSTTFREKAGPALDSFRLRPKETRPGLRLLPRRELSASLGISASDIAASVYAVTEGIISGSLEIEGRPLDIRVSGGSSWNNLQWLTTLPLPSQDGPALSLSSLVDIEWIEAETALIRLDRCDVIYLDLFPSVKHEKQIKQLIADHEQPGVSLAGESVFTRYRSALTLTVILVLILLYLILGAQFESFILPLILMLAVPFSLAGAGPALLFSGSSLDSGAVLGLVALFGLAVNNGIIFYEISEEKIRKGFSPSEAVYLGALERFRPVLLTSLTTVFALLPLVISPLGNSQRGMAAGMLGGIVVSGLLAFFALPPVFIRFHKSRRTA